MSAHNWAGRVLATDSSKINRGPAAWLSCYTARNFTPFKRNFFELKKSWLCGFLMFRHFLAYHINITFIKGNSFSKDRLFIPETFLNVIHSEKYGCFLFFFVTLLKYFIISIWQYKCNIFILTRKGLYSLFLWFCLRTLLSVDGNII